MNYQAIWTAAFREAFNAGRPFAVVNFENGMRTFFND